MSQILGIEARCLVVSHPRDLVNKFLYDILVDEVLFLLDSSVCR